MTPVETTQGSMGFVEALFDRSALVHKCLSSQQGLSGGCNSASMKEIIQEMDSIKRERREIKPARQYPQPRWMRERDRHQGQQWEREDRTPPCTSKDAQSGSGHGRPRPGPYPPQNRREYGARRRGGGPGKGRGQWRGT